jgi:hypothetical protein
MLSKPVEINPEMNMLLDDGNDELQEYIATLELDRIVFIPINPSDVEVKYEHD